MNPYQFETTCSVCGGPGMATLDAIYGGAHQDPSICRYYLNLKRKKLEAQEKELQKDGGPK